MSHRLQAAAFVAALASTVKAHGHLAALKVDGQAFTAYDPSFQYQSPPPEVIEWSCPECLDNGFVDGTMYNDATKIACHKDATAGAKVAQVKAGGTVDITWTPWPSSHAGPVIDYLAAVPDATSAKSTDLSFFKIDEAGYSGSQWASDKLIANNNTWTVTIPTGIPSGQYVLRHEIIALHAAGQVDGAQNYPKCVNIEVTGGSGSVPAGVAANKLYTPTDPGIKVDIYNGDLSSYQIPGPPLAVGGGSGSGSGAGSGTAAPSTPSVTSAPAAPVSSPTAKGNAVSSPAAAVPTPTSTTGSDSGSSGSGSGSLPQTFTLDTFIAWLQEKAGASKLRRHARAF